MCTGVFPALLPTLAQACLDWLFLFCREDLRHSESALHYPPLEWLKEITHWPNLPPENSLCVPCALARDVRAESGAWPECVTPCSPLAQLRADPMLAQRMLAFSHPSVSNSLGRALPAAACQSKKPAQHRLRIIPLCLCLCLLMSSHVFFPRNTSSFAYLNVKSISP